MHWPAVVISVFSLFVAVANADHQSDFEDVKWGLAEYLVTGTPPAYFLEATERYQLPHLFSRGFETPYETSQICSLCTLVVDLFILQRMLGASDRTLSLETNYICTRLGFENERVCAGVIKQNIGIILYIMDNMPDLASDKVCGSALQVLGCTQSQDLFEWTIDIPEGDSRHRPVLGISSPNPFKVLHLSDIHHDPYYRPGGKANCGEPICCQEDQGDPESAEDACGYWSDYRDADTPWHLVEETVLQAKTASDFEYVYYTGDIVSHRIWETGPEINSQNIKKLLDYFKEKFDVPVFPVFGNHESHPLNEFAPEGVSDELLSLNWLLKLAAEEWTFWLGEEARDTILKGGYYSVSPKPGFRVIGINSNVCNTVNWWLIYEDKDPFGQLQWLADTLKLAEDAEESVHILSHVPTGDDFCLKVWSREYHRIVERFQNTITGQFNGHTHFDEFHVFYSSSNTTKAIGASFNGASVTPYSNLNPSYKYYSIDPVTFTVHDAEEWTFDLDIANGQGSTQRPEWYKLYSFAEAYGVSNLQPSEVAGVVERMAKNHSLIDTFYRYKFRNAVPGMGPGCDRECQKAELCYILKSKTGDNTQCDYYSTIFDQYV